MSNQVDVLAVMDGCESVLRSNMRRRNKNVRIPDPHPEAVVLQERAAYLLAIHAEARAAVAELIEFRNEVAQIADDFIPDRDSDAPLALGEMRDALTAALAKVTGENS